jgi:hypothetical protein
MVVNAQCCTYHTPVLDAARSQRRREMTTSGALLFSGTRWQAAQVRRLGPELFELTTGGRGRRWEATEPEGFWRTLAELDIDSGKQVRSFVRRHGDPFGQLAADAPQHTGHWKNLAALLGVAARAWEPPGRDGVSRLTRDRDRLGEAMYFLRDAEMPLLKGVEPTVYPTDGSIVLRATSLAAFMAVSASMHLQQRVAMRQCQHCRTWLAIGRSDTRFCSASCRVYHSQKRK